MQKIRIGINGFGRIGKLGARVVWDMPELQLVHINEPNASVEVSAHLLEFDSIHGKFMNNKITHTADSIIVDGQTIQYSRCKSPEEIQWGKSKVDVVVECSGKFKTRKQLQRHIRDGVKKVVVSAPVKPAEGIPNIVYGINDDLATPEQNIVTAASCTTNCIAPVVKVIDEAFGIRHACITTIHDVTNTQRVVDVGHSDLRRARSCLPNLIPTTTGSAKAITYIYPHLKGKINGLAVRVPILNASVTDLVFEVKTETTKEEVNAALKQAAEGSLKHIFGFEPRPLVSVDYMHDKRSSVADGPATMVVDKTLVKILAWYDNEWGYVNRMMDLTRQVGKLAVSNPPSASTGSSITSRL